ncbi:hypothetical protein [Escherichia coli]|uniref:hypothetical protein n=1 Tax=Escherichia coli TaxID=562 RepID=UPI00131ED2BB|nr:hypothetical protein [Escherichia coli]
MSRSAKPRKRKPAPQRSKLPRYVVKLHDDDFFDEEDAEALRFDNFDDAVECCADLNIPFFVDAGNKKQKASSRQPGGCGLSWPEITVIKTDNIIVFQVVICPVQLNPVNENLPLKEANFPAMS